MRLQGDALRNALNAIAERWPYAYAEGKGLWAQGDTVIACDGHIMLALPRAFVNGDMPPVPSKHAETIARWRDVPQRDPLLASSSSLLAFACVRSVDDPPCTRCNATGQVECDECDGGGEVECTCDCGHVHESACSDCEDGLVDCPDCNGRKPRYGTLLSAVLNTALLADILRIVADDRDIAVSLEPLGGAKSARDGYVFRPVADGVPWVALLMPMAVYIEATCAYAP